MQEKIEKDESKPSMNKRRKYHLNASNLFTKLLGASDMPIGCSAFQKDFKIRGFIWQVGQKDNKRQQKDYSNNEIISAVLWAITPCLYLQNVLEITENSA